jgi:hypothetical protein
MGRQNYSIRIIVLNLTENAEIYISREETVRGIYDKLQKHKYIQVCLKVELLNASDIIQVRGTPASGKTSLAKLLHEYILRNERDPWVTRVPVWNPREMMPRGGWAEWLSPRWSFQSGSVLIVDEAQSAYWDLAFWLELKAIKPESPFRVITFASYGSAGRNINDPLTPIHISPRQNISLIAHDHGDQIAVGLLLTKPEFEEFVTKLFVDNYFDVLFLDIVFNITRGHVGACEDFLRAVRAHKVT